MRIDEILKNKRTLSFEVFPPKKEGADEKEKLYKTIDKLKALNPDFISVTYGASGSNARGAAEIAEHIKSCGLEPLAHITGGPSTYEGIDALAEKLKDIDVENILALRGDRPEANGKDYGKHFPHATDLLTYLEKYGFCAGAACYPEGHAESPTLYDDIENLKKKRDCGAKFLITQLFYDNSYYYRLVNEARKVGVDVPVIPGIMPITNVKNIAKIKSMCGSTIPIELINMIEVFAKSPDSMREVGINYAVYQICDLIAKGAPGVHIYTMNNADTAIEIFERLKNVINDYFTA
ncbi:MAG: methylenetetrahydrofolate reductase [Clostridiales bacterium]|nr:methylenetetrahydrofolate reductase [Clostridiales bacterium]